MVNIIYSSLKCHPQLHRHFSSIDLGLIFFETSAVTSENVAESFLQCARIILGKILSGFISFQFWTNFKAIFRKTHCFTISIFRQHRSISYEFWCSSRSCNCSAFINKYKQQSVDTQALAKMFCMPNVKKNVKIDFSNWQIWSYISHFDMRSLLNIPEYRVKISSSIFIVKLFFYFIERSHSNAC